MSDQPILLDRDGDIAILTLNRPASANAIDLAMTARLNEVADQLTQEGWARAVLLRSNGRLFSGGGDVAAFQTMLDKDELPSFIARLAGDLHVGLLKLLSLDAPLIVAVNGAAAGAGMSLVLAADLAYAGPRTRLVPAYPTIGFSADGGMSWTLPRIVGEKRAAEIMLLGETFTAAQAAAEHLVTAALDEDGEAFDAAVLDKARAVAAGPRRAFGAIRRLLRASAGASLSDQLANEAAAMADLATGADVAAGIAALAAKTRPVFTE